MSIESLRFAEFHKMGNPHTLSEMYRIAQNLRRIFTEYCNTPDSRAKLEKREKKLTERLEFIFKNTKFKKMEIQDDPRGAALILYYDLFNDGVLREIRF